MYQSMFPMFMQPMMPMGSMGPMMPMGPMGFMNPSLQTAPPPALQSMGGMSYGMPLTEEAQQEFTKSCLNGQKEQLLQTKKYLDEYYKILDESLSSIDSRLSKLSKTEGAKTEPDIKKPGK